MSDDAEGKYAVFGTNRDHVAPDEIAHVTNSYSHHWDIENQYKSLKAFLPKTSSKDYCVRLSASRSQHCCTISDDSPTIW